MKEFIDSYKNRIKQKIEDVDCEIVELIIKEIDRCDKDRSTVYIIGNGGSAATASHMQNDLGVCLKRRGVLNLNVLSLCDNVAGLTAISNDVGYEDVFHIQIKERIRKNDVLIALSCSGTSPNIVKAVKYAREIGTTIIGMTGFDGGELKKLSDINYHVQTEQGEYGVVEDVHMILDHMLYTYYCNKK